MIYVDMIVFYLQKAGGISSVWKELLVRFLKDKEDICLILQNEECKNIYFEEIMSYNPKTIIENNKSAAKNRYLPVSVKLNDNDKFVSTYYRYHKNKNVKQFCMVHDFTYEYYVKGLRKWVHCFQKKTCIKNSDIVVCVSNNTREDMIKLYPWSSKKESYVSYNASNSIYHRLEETGNVEELKEYNEKPFFLFVGSRVSYKRFDMAVEIVKCCKEYGLVIIGGGALNDSEKAFLDSSIPGKYMQLMGISDEKLNGIYNKAFALLYPSEYEGFGIPLLEAQLAGCPIVARNNSSIPEVIGEKNCLDVKLSASEIADIVMKPEYRAHSIEAGMANCKRFSWDESYRKYREIFEK